MSTPGAPGAPPPIPPRPPMPQPTRAEQALYEKDKRQLVEMAAKRHLFSTEQMPRVEQLYGIKQLRAWAYETNYVPPPSWRPEPFAAELAQYYIDCTEVLALGAESENYSAEGIPMATPGDILMFWSFYNTKVASLRAFERKYGSRKVPSRTAIAATVSQADTSEVAELPTAIPPAAVPPAQVIDLVAQIQLLEQECNHLRQENGELRSALVATALAQGPPSFPPNGQYMGGHNTG